jgi:hypothetical protein
MHEFENVRARPHKIFIVFGGVFFRAPVALKAYSLWVSENIGFDEFFPFFAAVNSKIDMLGSCVVFFVAAQDRIVLVFDCDRVLVLGDNFGHIVHISREVKPARRYYVVIKMQVKIRPLGDFAFFMPVFVGIAPEMLV